MISRILTITLLALLGLACSREADAPNEGAWVIKGATIYDGTGDPGVVGDVRIVDGKIAEIGDLSIGPHERVWEAAGLTLAPGFIDPHSHHADEITEDMAFSSVLAQGVTTVVGGLDGSTIKPVKEMLEAFEAHPAAFNLALYGGHNSYREEVMGEDFRRHATKAEIEQMRALLRADLEAGAIGLSTGLEYEPGLYSQTSEVIALAKDASAVGGRYASHIRSEDIKLWEAVEEFIQIARQAQIPAHYSHVKLAMSGLWGEAPHLVAMLDAARAEGLEVTGDIYPYDGWQSTMLVLLPGRDIEDRAAYEFAFTQIAAPEVIVFSEYSLDPSVIGKSLAQVSAEQGRDPVDVYMDMVQRVVTENADESIIVRNMGEEDIHTLIDWPYMSFTSDGGVDDRHPRGQGAFPKALRQYVREEHLLSLEQAIYKMSGMTADALGLVDRGRITPGYWADLVLFDAGAITDNGGFDDPIQYATGVEAVWVNGELVWRDGHATEARPGKALRRRE